jgi:hypothetical protein
MQRIDLQAILSGDFVARPSRLQQHFVRRPVLHLERRRFILAMIEKPVDLVQPLVQGAAVGDIHFLESAAIASTGSPAATARGISGSVVASRFGSCSVPGALAGPP